MASEPCPAASLLWWRRCRCPSPQWWPLDFVAALHLLVCIRAAPARARGARVRASVKCECRNYTGCPWAWCNYMSAPEMVGQLGGRAETCCRRTPGSIELLLVRSSAAAQTGCVDSRSSFLRNSVAAAHLSKDEHTCSLSFHAGTPRYPVSRPFQERFSGPHVPKTKL